MSFYYFIPLVIIVIMYGLILWCDREVNYASSEVKKVKLNNIFRYLFPHKSKYPNEIASISFFSQLLAYILFLVTVILSIVAIFISENTALPIFIIFSIIVIFALFIDIYIYILGFSKKDILLIHMQMKMKNTRNLSLIKQGEKNFFKIPKMMNNSPITDIITSSK